MCVHNVVEARCYVVDKDELILSRYVAESITTDYRTLRPRRPLSTVYKTTEFMIQKSYEAAMSCNQVVFDSATYLLTYTHSSSPNDRNSNFSQQALKEALNHHRHEGQFQCSTQLSYEALYCTTNMRQE